MTFDDYWANLQSKNTGLKDGTKMTISVESFRKSMEHAYHVGHEHRTASDRINDVFGKMFK